MTDMSQRISRKRDRWKILAEGAAKVKRQPSGKLPDHPAPRRIRPGSSSFFALQAHPSTPASATGPASGRSDRLWRAPGGCALQAALHPKRCWWPDDHRSQPHAALAPGTLPSVHREHPPQEVCPRQPSTDRSTPMGASAQPTPARLRCCCGRHDIRPKGCLGCENAVVEQQIYVWRGYDRGDALQELKAREAQARGAIAPRGLEAQYDTAAGRFLQPRLRQGWPGDIPAQAFHSLPVMPADQDVGMEVVATMSRTARRQAERSACNGAHVPGLVTRPWPQGRAAGDTGCLQKQLDIVLVIVQLRLGLLGILAEALASKVALGLLGDGLDQG